MAPARPNAVVSFVSRIKSADSRGSVGLGTGSLMSTPNIDCCKMGRKVRASNERLARRAAVWGSTCEGGGGGAAADPESGGGGGGEPKEPWNVPFPWPGAPHKEEDGGLPLPRPGGKCRNIFASMWDVPWLVPAAATKDAENDLASSLRLSTTPGGWKKACRWPSTGQNAANCNFIRHT